MGFPLPSRLGRGTIALLGAIGLAGLAAPHIGAQSRTVGGPVQTLTADDVNAVVNAAAAALSDDTMAVAVVDRAGTILAVYRRPGASPETPDQAVSIARTTAFFSNDEAPLSSRTVRFISGIHFPPGIENQPNAALYGVENINRGCDLGIEGDNIFNAFDKNGTPIKIDRGRTIAGIFQGLPCRPSDTRGCMVGGPIGGVDGRPIRSFGITTGKADLFDTVADPGAGYQATVNGGGVVLYRGGHNIGGVGVFIGPVNGVRVQDDYARAEFAAFTAATTAGRGITTAIDAPNPLPSPGAIFIDGLRLPFVNNTTRPAGSSPGSFGAGGYIVPPRDGRQAPEGYLIGPRASTVAGGLTTADVTKIVDQARAQAARTRAQVRLPYGEVASFIIAVTDQTGTILAEYRITDALFDAVDVVPAKARNAYYFSTREGYEVLKRYVTAAAQKYDPSYAWVPDPPAGQGWALTSRTISFGGQPLFPPGIDTFTPPGTPGPWFDLFVYDTLNPCTEGDGPSRGGNRAYLNQNGITWFPGSAPLYKNGALVGGIGVSGDGVEQNDLVTAAGEAGFEPPPELRVDNSVIKTRAGDVRLPWLKFPRNPEQP